MKPIIKAAFLSVILFTGMSLRATGQEPDYLIIKGKRVCIQTNPLETFLSSHPDRKLKKPTLITSCWRGYIATFEIIENKLFVQKIVTRQMSIDEKTKQVSENETDVTGELIYKPEERFCSWYTAVLILPEGELVHYVHMGYASSYERYTLIWIRDGILIAEKHLSLNEFNDYKIKKFSAFKETQEYKDALADSVKDGFTAKQAEGFLSEFFTEKYLSQP